MSMNIPVPCGAYAQSNVHQQQHLHVQPQSCCVHVEHIVIHQHGMHAGMTTTLTGCCCFLLKYCWFLQSTAYARPAVLGGGDGCSVYDGVCAVCMAGVLGTCLHDTTDIQLRIYCNSMIKHHDTPKHRPAQVLFLLVGCPQWLLCCMILGVFRSACAACSCLCWWCTMLVVHDVVLSHINSR